ncbi:hypothetical protein ACFL96_17035 [Thermoproteota archaeon]
MAISLISLLACVVGIIDVVRESSLESAYSLIGVGICGVIGLICLVTSIGLFMRKYWSVISLLCMSGLAMFGGLSTVASLLFIPQSYIDAEQGGIPMTTLKMFVFGFVSVFFVLIPLLFFIFFTNSKTKELFGRENQLERDPKKAGLPIGIKIISVYYLTSVLSLIALFVMPINNTPMIIGNFILPIGISRIYIGALSIIHVFIAIGFLRRSKASWYACLGVKIFSVILGLVNIAFTTKETYVKAVPLAMMSRTFMMNIPLFKIMMIISLIIPIIVVVYVYKRREIFFVR